MVNIEGILGMQPEGEIDRTVQWISMWQMVMRAKASFVNHQLALMFWSVIKLLNMDLLKCECQFFVNLHLHPHCSGKKNI